MTIAARVKAVRARARVRRWEYRQRNLAHGAWDRFRAALARAREAYAIDDATAAALLSEGFQADDRGRGHEAPAHARLDHRGARGWPRRLAADRAPAGRRAPRGALLGAGAVSVTPHQRRPEDQWRRGEGARRARDSPSAGQQPGKQAMPSRVVAAARLERAISSTRSTVASARARASAVVTYFSSSARPIAWCSRSSGWMIVS
jgi:hypothetical protein